MLYFLKTHFPFKYVYFTVENTAAILFGNFCTCIAFQHPVFFLTVKKQAFSHELDFQNDSNHD
jgi:hypothetical protein